LRKVLTRIFGPKEEVKGDEVKYILRGEAVP
jgi:hypothetical protein